MNEPTPPLDVSHGDLSVSNHLRQSLTILASRTPDPAARAALVECISGRESVRELIGNEAFATMLDNLLPRALAEFHSLSEEQLIQMAAGAEDTAPQTSSSEVSRAHLDPDFNSDADDWPGRRGILSSEW
ncbi:hypothetical protein GS466_08970 [Rhodococcus hoagii]|nr:hypothetical protein [Prescottella equi]